MRYSGRVFNFKLVSFAAVKEAHGVRAHLGLKLKTWVRFCPDSFSLSRDYQSRHKCVKCVCVCVCNCYKKTFTTITSAP
jgi:hypothetical protein